MSSRVIKETVLTHPLLTKLGPFAQDQFIRWCLLPDDWGCFNADPDYLKGTLYPKRKEMTAEKIEKVFQEIYHSGLMFAWQETGTRWGYFTWWDTGLFCGVVQHAEGGKRVRNRRKTPTPPIELLNMYYQQFGDIREQLGAVERQVGAFPPPPPLPFPPSPSPIKTNTSSLKKPRGEFGHVLLSADQMEELEKYLGSDKARDRYIRELDEYGEQKPKKFAEYSNHFLTIKKWARKNGEPNTKPAVGATHDGSGARERVTGSANQTHTGRGEPVWTPKPGDDADD